MGGFSILRIINSFSLLQRHHDGAEVFSFLAHEALKLSLFQIESLLTVLERVDLRTPREKDAPLHRCGQISKRAAGRLEVAIMVAC